MIFVLRFLHEKKGYPKKTVEKKRKYEIVLFFYGHCGKFMPPLYGWKENKNNSADKIKLKYEGKKRKIFDGILLGQKVVTSNWFSESKAKSK